MEKMKKAFFYAKQVLVDIARLPQIISHLEKNLAGQGLNINNLNTLQESNNLKINQLEVTAEQYSSVMEAYDRLDTRLTNLQHILSQPNGASFSETTSKSDQQSTVNGTVADNHSFDVFYKEFEDRFRGSEELIKKRVSEHLHIFAELPPKIKTKKIIDIGCGRGEFLMVMKENGLNAHGIDMNKDMVERAINLGLSAEENDALSFLRDQPSSSLAAVTGFHIVEHIPFEPLMEIFQECYRTVAKGGLVLFETPNPKSLQVGADTFYTDPSHLKPLPPGLLSFMLEYNGFKPELLLLHKQHNDIKTADKYLAEVYDTVFGFADYAIVGRKI